MNLRQYPRITTMEEFGSARLFAATDRAIAHGLRGEAQFSLGAADFPSSYMFSHWF